jgi:esterase FrsA
MDPRFKYIGPPLEEGPLPTVFYFALSAEDSLHLSPFNQPALSLLPFNIRVFSITLPGHDGLPAKEAMNYWAEHLRKGYNIIEEFITQARTIIETLIEKM